MCLFLENVVIDDLYEKADAIFMQIFLPTFLKIPTMAGRNLHLKNVSIKCVKGFNRSFSWHSRKWQQTLHRIVGWPTTHKGVFGQLH